ncbi:hypothetical protein [Catenulispora sp. GAS73]|uniref:hypothetical protein n=1 Tax=Catenulispora sp. GAS73 TaxID=3156269 RepID=UPI003518E3F7
MAITTGAAPHEKVMTPPLATAATTAAEVQLAGLPSPTTVVGCDVSTACAAAGTGAWPSGLPNAAGAATTEVAAVDGAEDGPEDLALVFDGAEEAEDGDTRGVVAAAPVVGVGDAAVAEFAACAEVEAEELQAAVPIDTAMAMAASA